MADLEPAEIIRALTSIGPFLEEPNQRRALVWLATETVPSIRTGLDWDGPAEVFLLRLISTLPDNDSAHLVLSLLSKVTGESDGQSDRWKPSPEKLTINHRRTESGATRTHFRVFVSSPSDVADERAVATQVIQQLAYEPLLNGMVTTEVIAWDRPGRVGLAAGLSPQASIDLAGLTPESCDVVIVIVWSRIGTPSTVSRRETGTGEEYRRAMESFKRTGRPIVFVYRREEPALVELGSSDWDERNWQWQALGEFLNQVASDSETAQATVNNYRSTTEFKTELERHLREVLRRILSHLTTVDAGPVKPSILEPYLGLRPYGPQDAHIFFGRDQEVDDLVDLLGRRELRVISVIGSSGSGKSSLVQAGLLPRLMNGAVSGSENWRLVCMTPDQVGDHNPFHSLWSAIDLGKYNQAKSDVVEMLESAGDDASETTLLLIDQFEELFTTVDEDLSRNFIDGLVTAATTSSAILVVTLRADFYDKALANRSLAPLLRTGTYPLSAPGYTSLYEMISRPSVAAGITLARGLPERILSDTGTEPGALALMAFTLNSLHLTASDPKHLTMSDYASLGGVQGAIGRQGEEIFDNLPDSSQRMLVPLFRQLVSVNEDGEPTRLRANWADLHSVNKPMASLVDALIGSRLLIATTDSAGHPMLEVAHEAVFRCWPTLANWIDASRDDLRTVREAERACREWLRLGRPVSHLWLDERISQARIGIENLDMDLSGPTNATLSDFLTPESTRILTELKSDQTSPLRRAQIGERLAELGDPRAGVGLDEAGVPDIDWCLVQTGSIRLDGLTRTLAVDPFEVSRYPITCAQYSGFVADAGGYGDLRWWDSIPRLSQPPEAHLRISNHPMERISWYEAVAFCRWMSSRTGHLVRLPTEQEWQLAASGVSGTSFPWGKEWQPNRANTAETGLGRPTAVGMFPLGASSVGAMDLSGNVWEWCLNTSDDPTDVEVREAEQRAVRGGCWFHEGYFASAVFRNTSWDYAAFRSNLRGFRVVRPRVLKHEMELESPSGVTSVRGGVDS